MPAPTFFLFGAPRLERENKPVEIDTRKALALLAYLAVTRSSHSRDALAALLWPEYDQTHARGALRRTLSVLNTALGGDQLDIDREVVALSPGALLWVDVDEFNKRLAECKKHGHPAAQVCPRCITPLAEAVALARDDFMAGFSLRDSPAFDEWQFFQREALRRELAGVLEKLAGYHSAQQELDLATVYARRWLALDPLHEPAHRLLMQLYAAAGQRAAAVRQYQECVRILEQEMGIPPSEETTRLYEAIRQEHKDARPQGNGRPSTGPATPPHHTVQPAVEPAPLVGRAAEWKTLLEIYAGIGENGRWIVVEGEAGIGKTRLAEAFLAHVQERGARTLSTRAYPGETNLVYGPFVEAVRSAMGRSDGMTRLANLAPQWKTEVARLVPELDPDAQPHPLNSPGAQSRFFEGIRQMLLAFCDGSAPGVFFVDDLQWIDPASLDLLTYLVQRLRGTRLALLATWRRELTSSNERIEHLLAEAGRAGTASLLALKRLSPSDVAELARPLHVSSELAERLYRESEGLPFFIVEYLATMKESGAWPLPAGARDLLRSRLSGIGETEMQLLSAAAVIGRSFDFDTLRETSGHGEEEVVAALEDLMARRLVAEVHSEASSRDLAYDFGHEKLRALVYDETSQARRRLLHRRAAEALANRMTNRRDGDALAGQVAIHFRQAGQANEAATYFKMAGEHARSLYANAEALAAFQTALALDHPDTAALHIAIGELQTLMGDYEAALKSLRAAAATPEQAPRDLDWKIANVYARQGEWELAERHYQAALDAVGEDAPPHVRAGIHGDWSLAAHRSGDSARALALAQRSLELAQAAGDKRTLSQAHNILGILARHRGDYGQAATNLQQSRALADELGDPSARAAALNNLALVAQDRGDIAEGIRLAETALKLSQSQGDRHREAALYNNLADLMHAAGQSQRAMEYLERAVRIYAEIGASGGAWQPEIWKLAEW